MSEETPSILCALEELPFIEREVLKLRYGLGDGYVYTQKEVASIFKRSVSWVRTRERRGISSIRVAIGAP